MLIVHVLKMCLQEYQSPKTPKLRDNKYRVRQGTGDFEVTFLPKRGAGEGELHMHVVTYYAIQSPWISGVEHNMRLQ
jgi:hypothetical protein